MPELPEVETVKNIVEPLIKGKKIESIEIFYNRLIQSDINEFKSSLIDQTFLSVSRYGKYLFFHLTNDYVLITHLRMEGKFRYVENPPFKISSTSLIFHFYYGSALIFDDTRKFGLMYLSKENEYKDLPMIKKLGLEPFLIDESNISLIQEKLHKKKPIKELLMDQTILCGIGNIYADEILYQSGINPFTKGIDITNDEINLIIENAKTILSNAIKLGGSTIHSFHPAKGIDGKFQEELQCYGKEGKECPRCHTTFHKSTIGGRGTTFCPNCQINPYLKKAIGITGPIGSGKSTALKYLESKGYLTISSDEMVHELYRKPEIAKKLSRMLKINFNYDNENCRFIVRKMMNENPTIKKQIEDYVYPILENELIEIIRNNDDVAIEVPLLFKAHYEYMFKRIFVITVSKEKQLYNLSSRLNANRQDSIKLNNDYYYDKNNKDVVLIENNGDLQAFYQKIDENLI